MPEIERSDEPLASSNRNFITSGAEHGNIDIPDPTLPFAGLLHRIRRWTRSADETHRSIFRPCSMTRGSRPRP